jgi:short-subunit dehydrogenase
VIDKSILVTGCSTGIGYYCAKELKNRGYKVIATARNIEDVSRLKDEGFLALHLDLNSSDSIKNGVSKALKLCDNKLYALFNNGAFGQPGAIEDLSRQVLKEQFETNVFGTLELTNLVLPFMREQGEGRIVQNSSVLGFVSMKYRGAYNASKYALEGLSDTMRLELDGSNIFVSLIEPGPIRSQFRQNAKKKFLQNIDQENSFHKQEYKQKLKDLESQEDVLFTLGEDAVFKALIKALESKNPKARYRVTFPTKLFWFLKRVVSSRVLDYFCKKV